MLRWIQSHLTLLITGTAALIAFALERAPGTLDSINWSVLAILFSLMAIVSNLRSCNLFAWLSNKLLTSRTTPRSLARRLLTLTALTSMLITNDVALIAFIPFTLYLLTQLHLTRYAPSLVVLQTAAANLGSMALPIGNPQNLFLYATYNLTLSDFFLATLPTLLLSYLLLMLAAAAYPSAPIALPAGTQAHAPLQRPITLSTQLLLLILAVLTILRLISPTTLLISTIAINLIQTPKNLLRVDYGLLLTFIAFFIFTANLSANPSVQDLLRRALNASPFATAWTTSQFLSNVPAAILLAPYTTHWEPLLLGTNIASLGTPIASLASLISLNLYQKSPTANLPRYLLLFTLLNLLLLLPLLLLRAVA